MQEQLLQTRAESQIVLVLSRAMRLTQGQLFLTIAFNDSVSVCRYRAWCMTILALTKRDIGVMGERMVQALAFP